MKTSHHVLDLGLKAIEVCKYLSVQNLSNRVTACFCIGKYYSEGHQQREILENIWESWKQYSNVCSDAAGQKDLKLTCNSKYLTCKLEYYNRTLTWNVWYIRADFRLAPSQWETLLQSNAVSHWLGANLESALVHVFVPWTDCWSHESSILILRNAFL